MTLPSKIGIPTHQIKFYGPFDLNKLVAGMKGFLDKRNYELHEVLKMKKGSEGWKYENTWEAFVKVTPFAKKWEKVYFLINEVRDIEVVVDGKKQKIQHGRGIIEIKGMIEFNYDQDANPWPSWLLDFYLTYVIHQQYFGKWADHIEYEVQDYAQHCRKLLNFEVN